MRLWSGFTCAVAAGLALANSALGAPIQRARDLGVPFEGSPGRLDALTDVPGVEVGQVSIVSGEGPLKAGQGPVRTGVTVIFPRGRANLAPV